METSATQQKPRISRRRFLALSGATALGVPLYAAEVSRHEISVEHVAIRITGLPEAFRGFRILQISDFHYANFTEPFFLRLVVERVNHIQADLVVLTGDFISNNTWARPDILRFAYDCAAHLSHIRCPQRYAIMGNHDAGFNPKAVTAALEEHHIPVLNNEAVPLEREGQRIWLSGIGDAVTKHARLDLAIPPLSGRPGEPLILLAHEPDILPEVIPHGVDLMLSGHTHGGQVRLPFLPPMFLPELGEIYTEGYYRLGPTQLYVNRGLGAVGVPFRFNCPPEITVLTLA
ncbi:metallophosphoesterase [Silvibacterium dinghuense]|uniref:Metallophosphoesterase n=1 Tax=Silvibacterium dinghuense TaxID=1560006 RepID=A0A4Q1SGY5_9BACT|nr:metallophosphoesterase [Silvibacterium dinghuense]RXS96593.1 metallophosphoesterase [Silvibacterium dinghuense]GGG92077.1 putative metallophosphoesterase YkuE [Silvibacterium dinghuense]